MKKATPAVVVGLCSHGLTICRSLGRRGIPVWALESNRKLPGLKTRYARKLIVQNVNGPELIEDLQLVSRQFHERPVLFLTNDNMVRTVATHFDDVKDLFQITWPPSDLVLELLEKKNLETRVRAAGLHYPKTVTIESTSDLEEMSPSLQFPVALKPSTPLSPFKALRIESEEELHQNVRRYESSVGCFLLQEWISGTERNVYFASLYFDQEHKPIASLVGRKIRSFPRNIGGACSAEPSEREDILHACLRFFEQIPMRGPASLEVKEKSEKLYVIEPTIGRFDFWIKCCTANGVDMPFISYACTTGNEIGPVKRKRKARIWVDFEKDFVVFVESLRNKAERREALSFILKWKAFAMWSIDDIKPSLLAWSRGLRRYTGRVLLRIWGRRA